MSELIRWQDKDLSEYYNADEVDAVLAKKDKEINELRQKLQDQCASCPVKAQEADVVAELKKELEDAKATAYVESVDAGMRERRLKRALYKSLANWAHEAKFDYNGEFSRWDDMEQKCLIKVEELK